MCVFTQRTTPPGGSRGIRGRPDFSRFDPSLGGRPLFIATFQLWSPPAERIDLFWTTLTQLVGPAREAGAVERKSCVTSAEIVNSERNKSK